MAAVELGKNFRGQILAAGGFDGDSAEAILKEGHADLVVFDSSFTANPDLPVRLQQGLTLNPYDRDTHFMVVMRMDTRNILL